MDGTMRQWVRGRVTTYLQRVVRDGDLGRLPTFLEPVEATPGPPLPHEPRLAVLGELFRLDPAELAVLYLAASPSMSVDVHAVYRTIQTDPLAAGVGLGLVCDLATDDAAAADALLTRLRQHSNLVRAGLLTVHGDGPWAGRSADVPVEVIAFLSGHRIVPSAELAIALRDPPQRQPWPDEAQQALAQGCRSPFLALAGPAGSGRASALACVMGDLLVVDLSVLVEHRDWVPLLDEAYRVAGLCNARLIIDLTRPLEAEVVAAALRWLVAGHRAVVFVPADAEMPDWARRRFTLVEAPVPRPADVREAWCGALAEGEYAGDVDRLGAHLARRFPLGTAAIRDVVRRAEVGQRGLDGLYREVRRYVPHTLSALAERYETRLTWGDVVLADETRRALNEILLHARQHDVVFDQWGFQRLLPYGRGLGCLFAGPPGTGKTMIAGIIANELQRELYRVDISRIVSKWLGETEKSLARLFDEAERAGAILFFDEADSLFAKRTDVRGSNDRYANMEVNFLLQRMERFDGMSILATNLEQGLDAAFKRRLRFTVQFPEPSVAERAMLWQKMLGGDLPMGEVDADKLGRRFRFTGALIKNTVLRAAFYAAERGQPIDTALLLEAGEAEMMDRGRL